MYTRFQEDKAAKRLELQRREPRRGRLRLICRLRGLVHGTLRAGIEALDIIRPHITRIPLRTPANRSKRMPHGMRSSRFELHTLRFSKDFIKLSDAWPRASPAAPAPPPCAPPPGPWSSPSRPPASRTLGRTRSAARGRGTRTSLGRCHVSCVGVSPSGLPTSPKATSRCVPSEMLSPRRWTKALNMVKTWRTRGDGASCTLLYHNMCHDIIDDTIHILEHTRSRTSITYNIQFYYIN